MEKCKFTKYTIIGVIDVAFTSISFCLFNK